MKKRYVYRDEANAGDGVGASAGSAAAPGSEQAGSVLAAAAAGDETAWMPEKFRVAAADGSLDVGASSRKLAEAYGGLEKRFGGGDAPPKSDSDYTVAVPDALKDHWKPEQDTRYAEFRKAAHEAGLSQKQFDMVMGRYFDIAPQLVDGAAVLDNDQCMAELRKSWASDGEYQTGLNNAYKALNAFGGDDAEAILQAHGNDPGLIRLLARAGAELGEDAPPAGGNAPSGGEIQAMLTSEAYTNPKHPEHAAVSEKVRRHFEAQARAAECAGTAPVV